jgi:hypothetical protein
MLVLGPSCIKNIVLAIKDITRKNRIKLNRIEYLDLKIVIFVVKSQKGKI